MFIVIILYFLFIIWLLGGIKKLKKEANNNGTINTFVSVIIAVKDEENSIRSLLNALKNQSYKKENFEIPSIF